MLRLHSVDSQNTITNMHQPTSVHICTISNILRLFLFIGEWNTCNIRRIPEISLIRHTGWAKKPDLFERW